MPELKFHRSYRDGIEVRVIDEEQRVIDYVASTEAVDRGGDVIRVAGWLTKNFMKNPVMPWAHDYSQLPVAKALAVKKDLESKRLLVRAQFAGLDQFHPHAESVFRMILFGAPKAASVGLLPYDVRPLAQPEDENGARRSLYGGREFRKQDLLELSPCVVPMNPEALADMQKALGDGDAARAFLHDAQTLMQRSMAARAYEIEVSKAPDAIRALVERADVNADADPLEDKGWGDFSDPKPYEVQGAPAAPKKAIDVETVLLDVVQRLAALEVTVAQIAERVTACEADDEGDGASGSGEMMSQRAATAQAETLTTTVERTIESVAEVDFAPLLAHIDQRFTELREHLTHELDDLFVDRTTDLVNDVTSSHDAPPAQARGVEDSPPAPLPTPGGQGAVITLDADTLSKIATLVDERVNAQVDRRIGAVRAPGGST